MLNDDLPKLAKFELGGEIGPFIVHGSHTREEILQACDELLRLFTIIDNEDTRRLTDEC